MSAPKRAVIIGGGIGGLATACLLAKAGYRVTLHEARGQLGGRAGQLVSNGFTFDTGPSWYLMPEVYDRFFGLMDKKRADYYELVKLTPAYQLFFESQPTSLIITGDEQIDAATFEGLEPGAGRKLTSYLDSAERIYRLSMQRFLYTTFKPKDLLQPRMAASAPELVRIVSRSIDKFVGGYFSNQKLRQILEYPAVFLGSSPFSAPALYHLMSYLDFRQGVYYPRGGMYRLIEALQTMAADAGVELRTSSPVRAIEVQDKMVSGIRLENGERIEADYVISNADLHYTQTQLLEPPFQDYPERYWQRKEAGPSALLLYLGVRGACPQLQHHNLLFVDDWRGNFEAIFERKVWPTPASMYVCRATTTDPTSAPTGHENIFVLVPLPARTDSSHQDIATYTGRYIEQIADMCGIPDLKQRIVYQHAFTPKDFEQELHAWEGTALGLSHRLTQSAFFRPSTKSKKVAGLYYVGANVQPGVGLPMCLISAELVAGQIIGRPYAATGGKA